MPDPRSKEQLMDGIDGLLRTIFGHYLKHVPQPRSLSLTVGQMACLRAVGKLRQPTMSELAQWLDLRPSTVTGLVDALVQQGQVERREDPGDRRVVRVQLTAKGRRERDRHLQRIRQRLIGLLDELPPEELVTLHDSLATLREAAVRRFGKG